MNGNFRLINSPPQPTKCMWKFLYSNPLPATKKSRAIRGKGDFEELIKAIQNGANIRIGNVNSDNIAYMTYATESVRYWQNPNNAGDRLVIASTTFNASEFDYNPNAKRGTLDYTKKDEKVIEWVDRIKIDAFPIPAIGVWASDGSFRFRYQHQGPPYHTYVTTGRRVNRWFSDGWV